MIRATNRQPERHSGHGDEAILTHNTLSADTTHVQVFYPFHPLHGYSLRVVRRPKRGDGAVSVVDPAGKRLKIPVWMLLSECASVNDHRASVLSRNRY